MAIAPLASGKLDDASTPILERDERVDVEALRIHDSSRGVRGSDKHGTASGEETCGMLANRAEALNGHARSRKLDLAKVLRDLGRYREAESGGANLIEGDAADLPRQSHRAPDLVVY